MIPQNFFSLFKRDDIPTPNSLVCPKPFIEAALTYRIPKETIYQLISISISDTTLTGFGLNLEERLYPKRIKTCTGSVTVFLPLILTTCAIVQRIVTAYVEIGIFQPWSTQPYPTITSDGYPFIFAVCLLATLRSYVQLSELDIGKRAQSTKRKSSLDLDLFIPMNGSTPSEAHAFLFYLCSLTKNIANQLEQLVCLRGMYSNSVSKFTIPNSPYYDAYIALAVRNDGFLSALMQIHDHPFFAHLSTSLESLIL